jgi:hypothetical protein
MTADDKRIATAFRATFWITAAVLALSFALLRAHGEAAPPSAQPVADQFGWPI